MKGERADGSAQAAKGGGGGGSGREDSAGDGASWVSRVLLPSAGEVPGTIPNPVALVS